MTQRTNTKGEMTYKAIISRASSIEEERPLDGAESVELEFESGVTLTKWIIEFDHIDDILDRLDHPAPAFDSPDDAIVIGEWTGTPAVNVALNDVDYEIIIYDHWIE